MSKISRESFFEYLKRKDQIINKYNIPEAWINHLFHGDLEPSERLTFLEKMLEKASISNKSQKKE